MKDEIKEISDNIRKIIKSNREDNFNRVIYDCDSLEKLLDYITNLQEENKRLKEDFKRHIDRINELTKRSDNLQEENVNLKTKLRWKERRIYKAIEYIKICRDYHKTYHKEEKIFTDEITSLLMILQGEDKE